MCENKLKAQTSAGKVMSKVFCDSDGIVTTGIEGETCHKQCRAICVDIKEVKTTNSNVSAKKKGR